MAVNSAHSRFACVSSSYFTTYRLLPGTSMPSRRTACSIDIKFSGRQLLMEKSGSWANAQRRISPDILNAYSKL